MNDCESLVVPMEMSEIIPGKLYLGGLYDAADRNQIEKFKIEAILNVASFQGQPTHGKVHRTIYLHDGIGNDSSDFSRAVELLEKFMDAGICTLVHCHVGVSRSPTIVATYLAKKNKISFKDSLIEIYKKRDIVNPHPALRELAKKYLKEI